MFRATPSIGLLFLLFSCVYENNEVYINPIEPPTSDGASINLNLQEDPLSLYSPTTLNFSVNPTGKGAYEAKIKINGVTLYTLMNDSGQFSFVVDPNVTGDGSKTLQIEIRYSSLSNSLAGQLGIETVSFAREWTLIVDTSEPTPLEAPEVFLEDGKSMVKWSLPDKFTFTELIVFRTYLDAENKVVFRDSIKISERNTTIFHDASYVGGPVKYRIDLKGYKYYVQGAETYFNITPLSFSLNSMSENQILSWNISPLYNNDISVVYNGIIFPINQPGYQSFDVRFGQPNSYEFSVNANTPPPSTFIPHKYTTTALVYKGIKIPNFHDIKFFPSKNYYLIINRNTIYRLDANTFQITGTYDFTTPAFRYLLTSSNDEYIYVYYHEELYTFDSDNMEIVETINLTSIIGQANQGFTDQLSLSNTNIVAFRFGAILKGFAIDLNLRTIVWELSGNNNPVISPNGQYIYFGGAVYETLNNNWDKLTGTISAASDTDKVLFNQVNGNDLIVSTFSLNNFIYDLNIPPDNNGTLNPSITLPNGLKFDIYSQQFWNYELVTDFLGYASIFNSSTLEEIKYLDNIYEPSQLTICNGLFFHFNGYIWP